MHFVIIARDARVAREKRPQVRPAHLAYFTPLYNEGIVVFAGPLTDGAGSLIVVKADSLSDAWQLMVRDPYVAHGIFEDIEIHPFTRTFPPED